MITFFTNIFEGLSQQNNQVVILIFFIAFLLLALLLRITAHLHFRGTLIAFQMDAKKEIATKADFAKLKNGLLRRSAADYIRMADRAVYSVPSRQIAERIVAKKSLFGWRYDNVLPLVHGIEAGLLWVGLVLAVAFNEHTIVFGTMAVLSFALTRLCAAFFNAHFARAELVDELQLYLDREVGRFFASDTSGAILRLKNEIADAMKTQSTTYRETAEKQSSTYSEATLAQSTALKNTMENVGHIMATALTTVSESMEKSTASIGPAVAEAMDKKLINMNDTLTETLQNWQKALLAATSLQTDMNASSERLAHASIKLQTSSELLATHMQGHSGALSSQLTTLVQAIDEMKNAVTHFATQQESLTTQAKFIERNQQTLDASLQTYEDTLRGLTQSLGEGLGAFINLHAQTSAQAVNDALRNNIEKIVNRLEQPAGRGL